MLMGILSALGIAGNLIHDYHSRNEGMAECNRYIAQYGEKRGRDEYIYLRRFSGDARIERIAQLCDYIPYSDMELKHIKANVEAFVEPQYSKAVLDKYEKETGETLKYILDVKWDREGTRPYWARK